jgi:glucose-1-phosphate thymidylyltransferase
MKAIVLAAGYATRLRPLTETVAKPLLPIAGRPMIDYVCDKIDEVAQVDALHVVTNARFAGGFEQWAQARRGRLTPAVHDDGTTSNEDRLGAIGDILFTIERANLAGQDLLIVAGDNLFDFSLAEYAAFWQSKDGGNSSCIALYECPDLELVKQYSVVALGENDRVVSFVEKPAQPESQLVGIATYLYAARHAALIRTYLDEGNSPDAPGNFVAWLHRREPVYGYRFSGYWVDIGNHQQLLEADNRMRQRHGLPTRDQYTPD